MLDLSTAYTSCIGQRPRNEDACGYLTSAQGNCWVVSDGAGGHGSGDLASKIVVSTVLDSFSRQSAVNKDNAIALLEAAQAEIIAAKAASPNGNDMRATAAILLIDARRHEAVWSHTGDTRIYLFRNYKLLHQTRDHSLLQGMIDAGYGNANMIRNHPGRSLLTSAIGNTDGISLSVSGDPVRIEPGDAFLICSDGWWEHIDESTMASELAAVETCSDWLARMTHAIEVHDNKSIDNYTAVAVRALTTADESTVLKF
jgi:serine/threonine protein phosphatase PrpC